MRTKEIQSTITSTQHPLLPPTPSPSPSLPSRCGLPPIACAPRCAPRVVGRPAIVPARLFPLRFAIAGIHAEQPPAARPTPLPSTLAPAWPCAGGAPFPSPCRLRGARGHCARQYTASARVMAVFGGCRLWLPRSPGPILRLPPKSRGGLHVPQPRGLSSRSAPSAKLQSSNVFNFIE